MLVKNDMTVDRPSAAIVGQPHAPRSKKLAGRSAARLMPFLCSMLPTSGTARNTTPSSSSAICTMSVYVTAIRPPVET